ARARDLQEAHGVTAVAAPRLDLVEASLALTEGSAARAQELLEPALAATDDPADRAELSAALAEGLAVQGSPDAARHYATALRLVSGLVGLVGAALDAVASAVRVASRSSAVIRSYAANDLILDAVQVCEETLAYAAEN